MAQSKKTLHVKQIHSAIGCPETQHKTLKAIGLGRIGKESDLVDNDCTRGMIFKVKHLVEVTE
ncbi:MAG: 50S ribosomal protein L30 [Eggerthellaceae bacterium]|jgi:large subunit ribosomal protein L30|nr:50S ribosomal protein L30 [Eggerthellaceae bacterium]MCH4220787.1 50S ribosomal protein L30 [Eggerthellaceae bacterium]